MKNLNIFSLFENEKLATVLAEVIRKERPKSDLEKTKWWNLIICESLVNEKIKVFIREWPRINPKYILHRLTNIDYKYNVKIHDCLKESLINYELINIIKKEQNEIFLKSKLKLPLSGPKPSVIKESKLDCVAHSVIFRDNEEVYVAHPEIYSFLGFLADNWIKNLKNFSVDIDCWTQNFSSLNDEENKEKNWEIAEIIFANFPKTFDHCEKEKEYDLYICGFNWNCSKYEIVNGEKVFKLSDNRTARY